MDDGQEEDRGGDGIERIGVDARGAQRQPQAGAWQVWVAGERQGERRDDLGLKHWEVRGKRGRLSPLPPCSDVGFGGQQPQDLLQLFFLAEVTFG